MTVNATPANTPVERLSEAPTAEQFSILRAAGCALVVAHGTSGLPEVLHWGRDPGELTPADLAELRFGLIRQVSSSALDAPWPLTILPTEPEGWEGRPALTGQVSRQPVLPRWTLTDVATTATRIVVTATAPGLALVTTFDLDAAGVLRLAHAVTNTGTVPLEIGSLEAVLPFDQRATEVLDFTGRWTRERSPQRRALVQGSQVRESRRGRTGHDSPTLLIVGTPGFGDRTGQLWAAHLAWSGDSVYRYDNLPEGRSVLGVGELLRPGEIVLARDETFTTPTACFVWSDAGLDGLSDRLHRSLRARPNHPASPRPVYLNTWEAVYFKHDLDKLGALADAAGAIGVERFVLDDGWFTGRRGDTAGLGDWYVDSDVWPDGLAPLVDRVRANGMQFGLWVEPEMVNLDSNLARAHPDWLLVPVAESMPRTWPRTWRNQYVLDLARPEVQEMLLERLSALVTEYRIDYLKWDQNRDLLEAVHTAQAGVDAHTRALYAVLDALRARHPELEIESCASGGARVDLGILERTDRVWASDTNDPIERLRIQRWTELLIPPELIGSHLGAARAHTTGRVTDQSFRMAACLFASAGIEWDITRCSATELEQVAQWISLYKRLRSLVHTGVMVHGDSADGGESMTGVIAQDRSRALYRLTRSETGDRAVPPPIRFDGLDPARRYRVSPVAELALPRTLDAIAPPWLTRGSIVLTGAVLQDVGVQSPLLAPSQALVLEVEAI
jgi:alpha-galactosidase